ncbi:hypothetical protein BDR06DRAFT_974799 [Suillus hirtellus]|nr:hypothetical protein BDR06DRAFT_974799 [Suillus hirtellus]
MTGTVHTDNENEPIVHPHPLCKIKPTAALLQHSEKAALPSQTKAINEFSCFGGSAQPKPVPPPLTAIPSSNVPPPPTTIPSSNVPPPPSVIPLSNKHLHPDDTIVNIKDKESVDKDHNLVRKDAHTNPKPHRKKQKAPDKSPELVDRDGVFININVLITDPGSS